MVKAAAGNEESGEEVITLLLDKRGADVVVIRDSQGILPSGQVRLKWQGAYSGSPSRTGLMLVGLEVVLTLTYKRLNFLIRNMYEVLIGI